MSHRDLVSWLEASMSTHASRTAMGVRRAGAWTDLTYRELDDRTRRLARALRGLGLARGERVAIHGGNSPEWSIVDIACVRAGLVSVPVYTTNSPRQVAHVLRDSGARVVFSGTPELRAVVEQARAELGGDAGEDADATATGPGQGRGPGADRSLRSFLLFGDADQGPTVADLIASAGDEAAAPIGSDGEETVDPDDPLTIIYTSGTTGDPKGVVLTHRNLCHQLRAIGERFDMPAGERNMSFLPLAHAYERAWTYVVLTSGLTNCYVTDPKTVAAALLDIRPATFVSVPRLYEKVYAGAHAKAGTGARRRLFDWAVRVGGIVEMRRQAGQDVPRRLAAQHVLADRLVLKNVRDAVGGPKSIMAAGGAPLRREVEEFFLAAGLHVYQGYGLTETAPMVSCNAPGATRFGTVGRPVPGTQVRIAGGTGEILVRGEGVMAGYHGRPEDTAQVVDDDGWFHTGDVGYLDHGGYLVITDRIKDLIVTMQGKNIAPGPIESAVNADPLVEASMVVGDGRPYLVALLQPSFEALEEFADDHGLEVTDQDALLAHPEVTRYYEELIARIGEHVARHERIQSFRLLDEPLTMDAGDLTPTLKVRRGPVEARFAHLIEDMYAG